MRASVKCWMDVDPGRDTQPGREGHLLLVADGLKGRSDSVSGAFPQTIVQICIIHLPRNTLTYSSKTYLVEIAKDLKPIYTAPSAKAAWAEFEIFDEEMG